MSLKVSRLCGFRTHKDPRRRIGKEDRPFSIPRPEVSENLPRDDTDAVLTNSASPSKQVPISVKDRTVSQDHR